MGSRVSGSTAAITATQRSSVHYFKRPDIGFATLDPAATSLAGYGGFVEIRKDAGTWLFGAQVNTRSPGFELNDADYQTSSARNTELAWVTRRWLQPGSVFRSFLLRLNQWYDWDYDGKGVNPGVELIGNSVLRNYGTFNFWTGVNFGGLEQAALRGGPALKWPLNGWAGASFGSDPRKAVRISADMMKSPAASSWPAAWWPARPNTWWATSPRRRSAWRPGATSPSPRRSPSSSTPSRSCPRGDS